MFGLPVVLNPIGIIPLILGPIVITVLNYYAMASGLVACPTGVIIPWTTPPLIQGFLITGHWTGAALQLVDIIVVCAVWLPFISMMDKRKIVEEQEYEEMMKNKPAKVKK